MGTIYILASAFSSGGDNFSDISEIAGTTAQAVENDYLSVFANSDIIQSLLTIDFPRFFAYGFASATLLALLTYGAFKVFGLIRIK